MLCRLLLLLLCIADQGISAQIEFTRTYPSPPRSQPLGLLNTASGHFFFMRYNRIAHDITIERRRKSDGGISAFVALRLDSVNAAWFDYQQLDHLFFEKDGRLYFVFERMLNKESRIYMKEIDTMCRAGGFIMLAELVAGKREAELDMEFSVDQNRQLVVVKTRNYGVSRHKEVVVIDPATRQTIREYRLPVENPATGYSREFAVDPSGNLFYLLYRLQFRYAITPELLIGASEERRHLVDSVFIVGLSGDGGFLGQRAVPLKGCEYIHAAYAQADSAGFHATCLFTFADSLDERKLGVASLQAGPDLNLHNVSFLPGDSSLHSRLTFFDGSGYQLPGQKYYEAAGVVSAGQLTYFLAERKQQNNYREMLVWCLRNGVISPLFVDLVPRKTFYFHNRAQHNTFGTAMHASNGDSLVTYLLEHPANRQVVPSGFRFRRFSRLESLNRATLASYSYGPGGNCTKRILWRNTDYSCVPLPYHGPPGEEVFYFVRGTRERFGIRRQNP